MRCLHGQDNMNEMRCYLYQNIPIRCAGRWTKMERVVILINTLRCVVRASLSLSLPGRAKSNVSLLVSTGFDTFKQCSTLFNTLQHFSTRFNTLSTCPARQKDFCWDTRVKTIQAFQYLKHTSRNNSTWYQIYQRALREFKSQPHSALVRVCEGKNLSCGEICSHDRFSCGEILQITDCHAKKFSTWEMWRQSVMWRNVYNL